MLRCMPLISAAEALPEASVSVPIRTHIYDIIPTNKDCAVAVHVLRRTQCHSLCKLNESFLSANYVHVYNITQTQSPVKRFYRWRRL